MASLLGACKYCDCHILISCFKVVLGSGQMRNLISSDDFLKVSVNLHFSNRNKYKTTKATPTKHGVHQVQCILRKQIEPFYENSFYF